MIKKALAAIAVLAVVSQTSHASIQTFSQADLLSMSIAQSTNFTELNPTGFQAGPGAGAYGGGNIETMTGVAGVNEFLAQNGSVYYSLTGPELAAFNAGLTSGDTLAAYGFNDNANDNWILGVWYSTDNLATVVESASTLAAGTSAAYSVLVNAAAVTQVGVLVKSGNFNDQFHASWAPIPEATSVAVWGGLSLLGLVGRRRRG